MMPEHLIAVSRSIAVGLSKGLTSNGLVDPVEQRVVIHSYMTEYFALQCGLLHSLTDEDVWLDLAVQAIEAALAIEKRINTNPSDKGTQYHWEFKNIGLSLIMLVIGGKLPLDLRAKTNSYIRRWNNLNIDSTNWTAMRALSYRVRHLLFGATRDLWRSKLEMEMVLAKQTPEGFFPDTPKSYSFQYHAYTLALLALMMYECGTQRVASRFFAGVDLISDFTDPDGDFNYYGRGQRQLFGYVSLIHALIAAARLAKNNADQERYLSLAGRVFGFVDRHQPGGNWERIVLNDALDDRLGWYDYNLAGDYLAFTGVHLLLSARMLQEIDRKQDTTTSRQGSYIRCYPKSGLGIISTPAAFAVVSSVSREPAEAFGLVHLWPVGATCFGGPGPDRSRLDYSKNYIGPLDTNKSPILLNVAGSIRYDSGSLILKVVAKDATFTQTLTMQEELFVLKQAIQVKDGIRLEVIPISVAGDALAGCNLKLNFIAYSPSAIGWKPVNATDTLLIDGNHESELKWSTQKVTTEINGINKIAVVDPLKRRSSPVPSKILKSLWVSWVFLETLSNRKKWHASGPTNVESPRQ